MKRQDPTTPSTTALRIRENQRRSRARRKEYINHLEERLQSFERLGVAASQEIQEAGRKVASENVLLRELLSRKGVSEREVEEYLGSEMNSSRIHRKDKERLLEMDHGHSMKTGQLPLPLETSPLSELEITAAKYPLRKPAPNRYTVFDGKASSEELLYRTSSKASSRPTIFEPPQCDGDQETCHSTSCETAARIIAGMRHNNPETDICDVRTELGCAPEEQHCMVRNMSIFEILDKRDAC